MVGKTQERKNKQTKHVSLQWISIVGRMEGQQGLIHLEKVYGITGGEEDKRLSKGMRAIVRVVQYTYLQLNNSH